MVWCCLDEYLEELCIESIRWSPAELICFGQSSGCLPTLSRYHNVSSCITPGVYPAVYDVDGVLTGGAPYSGLPSGSVDISEMLVLSAVAMSACRNPQERTLKLAYLLFLIVQPPFGQDGGANPFDTANVWTTNVASHK